MAAAALACQPKHVMPSMRITLRVMSAVIISLPVPIRRVTYCGKNRNTTAKTVTAQSIALFMAIMLKRNRRGESTDGEQQSVGAGVGAQQSAGPATAWRGRYVK